MPTAGGLAPGFVYEDVRRFRARPAPDAATRCGRPVIGPLVTLARRLAWRALGLGGAFNDRHHDLHASLTDLEALHHARSWRFRPGTFDAEIFAEVVLKNEYELPERFLPGDVVLDVGMHIGCFCLAALLRGAGRVHGFEPEQENFEMARQHLAWFGDRAVLHRRAVWRSDRAGDTLYHPGREGLNTGGSSVLWATTGQPLEAAPFDEVVRAATDNGRRRVRLVKLDCEGAEFPILLTSRTLHLVDALCGEFHEINDGTYNPAPISPVARVAGVERFTIAELSRCLERAGFTVRWRRNGSSALGLFFASRS